MCSYNRIDGTYACENRDTLTTILKRQFGFTGFVMSDWGATHSTIAAANAGLDMEMDVKPGQYFTAPLKTAVQDGQVPTSRLNDMVTRIVRTMFAVGIFDHPAAAEPAAAAANAQRPQDVALARSLSEAGTVLLKNQGQLLPLTGSAKRIAVIGPGAGPAGAQQFYNGAGSGHIPEFGAKSDVVTPLQGITQRALADGDVVTYADGSSPAAASLVAKTADVAIVFAGSQDSEGVDRSTLDLSSGNCSFVVCTPQPVDQDSLISQVAAANPHTIVVLNTGGPVLMPWLNQIQGLFEAWYPGQQDGNAIAALLFGDADPSAKLPETFPASQSDLPTRTPQQYPGVNDAAGIPHATYSEGLLVGYRWYDDKHITPLFPFGFGLTYTTFAMRNLHLSAGRGRPAIANATFTVADTGPRLGAEIAQLYVADPRSAGEPPKQLKGFQKVLLRPGARTTVKLPIDFRSLAHWSDSAHRWKVGSGCYRVLVGDSSSNLPLSATIAVGGARCNGVKLHVTNALLRRAARGHST
jgi:beta-glucosidase